MCSLLSISFHVLNRFSFKLQIVTITCQCPISAHLLHHKLLRTINVLVSYICLPTCYRNCRKMAVKLAQLFVCISLLFVTARDF